MKIERADGLAWRRVDRETFVVDLRRKWMYGLNEAGGMIWHAVVAGDDPDTIVRRMCLTSDGGMGEAQARCALRAFAHRLDELGLVICAGLDTGQAGEETADELCDDIVPRVIWQEELRAFAFSCSENAINCQDVQPTT